jgi:hypothetical protein
MTLHVAPHMAPILPFFSKLQLQCQGVCSRPCMESKRRLMLPFDKWEIDTTQDEARLPLQG